MFNPPGITTLAAALFSAGTANAETVEIHLIDLLDCSDERAAYQTWGNRTAD